LSQIPGLDKYPETDTWSAAVRGNDAQGHITILKSTEGLFGWDGQPMSVDVAVKALDEPLKAEVERMEEQARRNGAQYQWKIHGQEGFTRR
jgi:hypothetical protein